MTQKPVPGQAVGALHLAMHQNPADVTAYGATGNGTTDDSSAFSDAITAAGAGASIYIPPATYRVKDLTLLDGQRLYSVGRGAILKAATGATYVVKMFATKNGKVENVTIDGNSRAAAGLAISGSGGTAAQLNLCENVVFQNCSTGTVILSGTPDQADKTTFINCEWANNTTGLDNQSPNGQNTLLLNCQVGPATTGVKLSGTGASLTMLEGQIVTCTTSIQATTNCQWIRLDGVISEGTTTDLDCSASKPAQGIVLRQCILQASSHVFLLGVNATLLDATLCTFNAAGDLKATAASCVFRDVMNTYSGGAAWNPTGGTSNIRHQVTTGGGLVLYQGSTQAQALLGAYGTVGPQAGATGSRPTAANAGAGGFWYDTTVVRPIVSDGTNLWGINANRAVQTNQSGGGTVTPNFATASTIIYNVTDATAFTIGAPTNYDGLGGQLIVISVINASGGAMGAITWNGAYKFAAATAPASPNNGTRTMLIFQVGSSGNVFETGRAVNVA